MDAPSIDLMLQRALAQGDLRRASQLLVVHHADAVYATCRALVRDRVLAEDLSQETFTKALGALPSFRGDAQSRTWLLSIARNTCLDHLRRTRGPIDERTELDTEAQPSDAPMPFELLVRQGDVELCLSVLGETERAIVVLHHAHGVGYGELSSSFGIAEGALRMRMSRALLKMREALDASELDAVALEGSVSARRPAAAPMPAKVAADSRAEASEGIWTRLRRSLPGGSPPPPPRSAAPPLGPPPAPRAPAPSAGSAPPRPIQDMPAQAARPQMGAVPASAAQALPVLWAMPQALKARLLAMLPG